jgi:hypothetical protein
LIEQLVGHLRVVGPSKASEPKWRLRSQSFRVCQQCFRSRLQVRWVKRRMGSSSATIHRLQVSLQWPLLRLIYVFCHKQFRSDRYGTVEALASSHSS